MPKAKPLDVRGKQTRPGLPAYVLEYMKECRDWRLSEIEALDASWERGVMEYHSEIVKAKDLDAYLKKQVSAGWSNPQIVYHHPGMGQPHVLVLMERPVSAGTR